jgi:hypothetical protein
MRDIPIIYSEPMIKALLAKRKRMTRRLLYSKRKARAGMIHTRAGLLDGHPPRGPIGPNEYWALTGWHKTQKGDRLWVRENWRNALNPDRYDDAVYKADPLTLDGIGLKWKPSIHMPRWASRLTLIVTEVRIERLRNITDGDALAEGIACTDFFRKEHPPSICFSVLWDSLHGQGAWIANPDVVAISFDVIERNIDSLTREEHAHAQAAVGDLRGL